MLKTIRCLHFSLMFANTPALHALQLKHNSVCTLLHVLQSPLLVATAVLFLAGGIQNVAFLNVKLQSDGGLQQPDCENYIKYY